MRRRPGRPVGGQPVVDRGVVLDAAERVIARDGNGASLEAIAIEAGVTKPVVYARVGDRAALSNALSERLARRLIAAAGNEVDLDADPDRTMLAAFFRSNLELIGAHRELFLYVTRGAADDAPERRLYLAGLSAGPLAELLSIWRIRHGHDTAVAVPWAYAMVGMLNLVSLWWIEEHDRDADVLADQLAELVWSGLDVGLSPGG